MFKLSTVVTKSSWQDDIETLPHRQDLNSFSHFGCGGKSPLKKQNVKVCRVQTSSDLSNEVLLNHEIVSRDEKISELEQALRDVTLQDAKIESSRSDKEARKFVKAHLVVKDSRYEIPIPLKIGVLAIPDNMAAAKKSFEEP